MGSFNDIITSSITSAAAAPTQPGFGVPLLFGAAKFFGLSTDKIRFYSGTAGMISDGAAATDPELAAAAAIFAQNPTAPLIGVGRRTRLPTQQFKITVLTAVVGKVYSVVVNGVTKSYTAIVADTTTLIAAGLAAAIGTPTGFGAAANVAAVITFTASAAGNWARVSATNPNVDLDCWQSHADAGAQADLADIFNVDQTCYAIVSMFEGTLGSTNTSEVGQIAAYAESNGKLYLAAPQDSLSLSSSTTDICSNLKALSLTRTASIYHPDNGLFAAAAWAGARLPYAPGSETWMFAQLAGVTPVSLTATQRQNLLGKNCNYIYSVGGVSITALGDTALGATSAPGFIDYVRGKDWLQSRIQNRIFVAITSPANTTNPATGAGSPPQAKIPFSDAGIGAIEAELRGALAEGVAVGFLLSNPAPTVTVPKAAAVTLANRNARNLSPITWTATTAGAVHSVSIAGVLN